MSAFKGTPGPWQLSSESPTIIKQDMSLIGLPDGGVLIGSACGHESSGFYPTLDESEANARLIAAAPELLEALEDLIGPEDDPKAGWRGWTPSTEMFRCEFCGQEDLDCCRIQHDDRCPIKAARAAIAKATGGDV